MFTDVNGLEAAWQSRPTVSFILFKIQITVARYFRLYSYIPFYLWLCRSQGLEYMKVYVCLWVEMISEVCENYSYCVVVQIREKYFFTNNRFRTNVWYLIEEVEIYDSTVFAVSHT